MKYSFYFTNLLYFAIDPVNFCYFLHFTQKSSINKQVFINSHLHFTMLKQYLLGNVEYCEDFYFKNAKVSQCLRLLICLQQGLKDSIFVNYY